MKRQQRFESFHPADNSAILPGVTIKAQTTTRARVLDAVTAAVGGEVDVVVRELPLLNRIEVTLRPRSRLHGRGWRARVLAHAVSIVAGELPADAAGDVRWA